MGMLPPSGRKMLGRNLIFMTDTFSFYCQSAGTEIHSWLENLSLLHVSSDDNYTSKQELRAETTLFVRVCFFRGQYSDRRLPLRVLSPFFTFQVLIWSRHQNSRIEVHWSAPKKKVGKKIHVGVKCWYLICRQSNLSNERFIFVCRIFKLRGDILKYIFRTLGCKYSGYLNVGKDLYY